jgi:hypothetical protein
VTLVFSRREIAKTTKAEPALLARFWRYLAATRFITEIGQGQFGAHISIQSLAYPVIEGSLYYM